MSFEALFELMKSITISYVFCKLVSQFWGQITEATASSVLQFSTWYNQERSMLIRPTVLSGLITNISLRYAGTIPFKALYVHKVTLYPVLAFTGNQSRRLSVSVT